MHRDRTRFTKAQRKELIKAGKAKRLDAANVALLYGVSDGALYLHFGVKKKKALGMRRALGVKSF
jgi:hypothetical protein